MSLWRSLFVAASLLAAPINLAHAQTPQTVKAKNVVLVHGAWADGSSWSEVIPILQAAGLHVTAVQNPLSSLADSVEATKRALAEQDGPTVLVAHSWGGTVISQVGNDPKVTGLVYVAARAPDANEDFVALSKQFPAGPARAGIVERDGYTKLSEDAFLKYFANGVKPEQARSSTPCNGRRPPRSSPAAPRKLHGTRSRAGTRCRRTTAPSIPISNASSPSA